MVLFAKIHSYALNAYLDAQIAEEIITYVNSKGKSFATKRQSRNNVLRGW